jgi:cysteine-rich repeat protein
MKIHTTIGGFVFATLLVALGRASAAVDLSGDYVVTVPISCRITIVVTGTETRSTGFCGSTPISGSGTIDPVTGAGTGSFDLGGACAGVINFTSDGEVIMGSITAPCYSGPYAATKCGNGVIDPLENCEDGNQADGDCCSARCRLDVAGTACTSDGNDCTDDVCNATGTCTHVPITSPCDAGNGCTIGDACAGGVCVPGSPAPAGQACNDDLDPCTADVCDAAGTCTHVLVPPRKCRRAVASRDVARCMATQCDAREEAAACRRRCKPAAIRTLAYAQSECREDPSSHTYVAHQELRIRRGNREPITVATFDSPRVADPLGFCPAWGGWGFGGSSVVGFPLQRVGVSRDGSTIVYEVNDAAPFFPFGPLPPDTNGFFIVRADGTGRRRLGPPSGDTSFRIGPAFGKPSVDFGGVYTLSPPIAFSPDGRRITFTDLGPAVDGQQAVQIAVLDLGTGNRKLLTHLPAGADLTPYPNSPLDSPFSLTSGPAFVNNDTIVFQTYSDPEGARPADLSTLSFFTIGIDGRHLTALPKPALSPGAEVIPTFGVTGGRIALLRVSLPGTPAGPPVAPVGSIFPITEVFVQYGKKLLLQLTNYRRVDTFAGFLTPDGKRAVFMASADPVHMNPYGICQLFSVGVRAGVPRQITHLDSGARGPNAGCFLPSGIGYGLYRALAQDPVTGAIVFDTTTDALKLRTTSGAGADQIFAIRPDGRGLRQLTEAGGVTTDPGGSVRVELPGPYAYSGSSSSQ